MILRRGTMLISCVAMIGLSACGGGSEDVGADAGKDGVGEVVQVYSRAIAEADGPRACSLMSVKAQNSLQKTTETDGCLQAVEKMSTTLTTSAASLLKAVQIEEVTIQDSIASVQVAQQPEVSTSLGGHSLSLVRSEEHWYMDF